MLHQVVDDIGEWVLFERKDENLYAVGSVSVDRYLAVPESKLKLTMAVVKYLDGTHDLSWIQGRIESEFGMSAKVEDLLLKLRDAGLVKTAQTSTKAHAEVLRNSIVVLSVLVEKPFQSVRWLHRIFSLPALIGGTLLAAFVFWNSFLRPKPVFHLGPSYGRLGILGYVVLFVGVLGVALLHESFHGFAAVHYGLKPRRITVALYLGFIPYVYISIPGIYTIAPGKRIVLWSAGLYANMLVAAVLLLLCPFLFAFPTVYLLVHQLAIANVSIVLFNLSPFMSTDVYFILSTLLKAPNVRTRSYSEFIKWFRSERNTFRGTLAVYSIFSFAMVGYFAIRFLEWLWVTLTDIVRGGITADIFGRSWPVIFILLSFIVQRIWNYRNGTRQQPETRRDDGTLLTKGAPILGD